jgi:hypothetical protein
MHEIFSDERTNVASQNRNEILIMTPKFHVLVVILSGKYINRKGNAYNNNDITL